MFSGDDDLRKEFYPVWDELNDVTDKYDKLEPLDLEVWGDTVTSAEILQEVHDTSFKALKIDQRVIELAKDVAARIDLVRIQKEIRMYSNLLRKSKEFAKKSGFVLRTGVDQCVLSFLLYFGNRVVHHIFREMIRLTDKESCCAFRSRG